MTEEDEETMIPMNEVNANPVGIVMSCDQRASLGFLAKREKSGSIVVKPISTRFFLFQ